MKQIQKISSIYHQWLFQLELSLREIKFNLEFFINVSNKIVLIGYEELLRQRNPNRHLGILWVH